VELTPVEDHNGLLVKREDLYSGAYGVNGAKYRACQHLVSRAAAAGAERVVSAASVLSPQSAMAAVVAKENGLACTVIVGGTTPEKAVRHKSIAIAADAGADIEAIPVGYNPALQKASALRAQAPGAWRLNYGITTDKDASSEEVEAFLRVGAPQTMNLPDEVRTLIIPFGSGNTAAGVLAGLQDFAPAGLSRVVLIGI
jgi:L-cysteate sulfo-lyase